MIGGGGISGIGTLIGVEGNITTRKYIKIIIKNFLPVLARYFADDQSVFMDDSAPCKIY